MRVVAQAKTTYRTDRVDDEALSLPALQEEHRRLRVILLLKSTYQEELFLFVT